jgi:hypothetical protein
VCHKSPYAFVTGIRGSLRDALEVKRNSDLVVDAISADNIGQLPDVTIAESINRLPGVNATRDRGNDGQAVVCGLGARLVLGTVNGRVASSEPDRNVRRAPRPDKASRELLSQRHGDTAIELGTASHYYSPLLK